MITKKKRSNRLSKIKKYIIILLLIICFSLIFYYFLNNERVHYNQKLTGFWNIEIENSDWIRDSNYCFLDNNIFFTKDSVNLPTVNTDLPFFEDLKKSKGTWKIISIDPDTIFFNVPHNPLHGKYAIKFYIDSNGYNGNRNLIYKMELKNDSTYLICNKGFVRLF